MSTTTYIACRQCRQKLWIGQGDYIYLDEHDVMCACSAFLHAHRHHPLIFGYFDDADDQDGVIHYEDVDV